MLRACVLEFQGSWDQYIALMEFAYNNHYHSSIGMVPYEALYGRKCRCPLYWDEEGMRVLEGPKLVQETTDKVKIVRGRIKAAQDRQKSYVDQHCREMTYKVGDKVFVTTRHKHTAVLKQHLATNELPTTKLKSSSLGFLSSQVFILIDFFHPYVLI